MRVSPRSAPGAAVDETLQVICLVMAVALVVAHPIAAQTPSKERPPGGGLPAVKAEVVRLDVVVTEKGHPRAGLTREDFVVLEDGVAQTVTLFEAFAPVVRAAPAAATTAATVETRHPPGEGPGPPPPRFVVLAVDDVHMESASLARAKKALQHFLESDLAPEDQVAIVTASGVLSQAFTNDVQVLKSVVARLTIEDRGVGRRLRAPYLTEYQAGEILRGNPDALQVAVDEINYERPFDYNAVAEAQMAARQVFTESVHNARITLETLEGAVRGLTRLPGRKIVLLASDGFLTGLGVEGRAAFDMRRIADAATRAGVVIYSLDTRGLVAPVGFAASSRRPVLTSTYGLREQFLAQSEQAVREAMNALAADTGGFLYENSNDIGGGLRKILEDTETYYLLAYEPKSTRRDGAFRRIEVRVPSLHGARIRARTGYFAPDDRKPEGKGRTTDPAGTDATLVAERRESDSSAAPGILPEVPLRASADFVSVDGVVSMVVVSANVDLGRVSFEQTGGRHKATVDVATTVFDESGVAVGSLEPVRANLDLKRSRYERAVEKGLEYQRAAPVKPGHYRVQVAVRDAAGRLGTASQWVQVPSLSDGALRLSSVFLFRGTEGSGPSAGPVTGSSLLEAQALRRFERKEKLYVQAYVYNPARDASGKVDVVAAAEIWRGNTRVGSTPTEPMAQAPGRTSPLSYARVFTLQPFEPGSYEVRVLVTDRRAGAEVSGRTDFVVEPPARGNRPIRP